MKKILIKWIPEVKKIGFVSLVFTFNKVQRISSHLNDVALPRVIQISCSNRNLKLKKFHTFFFVVEEAMRMIVNVKHHKFTTCWKFPSIHMKLVKCLLEDFKFFHLPHYYINILHENLSVKTVKGKPLKIFIFFECHSITIRL